MSQVWIPVNASMRGFASTVAKEAAKAAGAGGRELETGFRKGGEAAGQAAADGLAAQAKKVDAASRALATARKAEAQASADVSVAEEKLNQLRESGNYTMGQLAKAETALEVAKEKAATAAERASAREADLNAVRDGGEATSRQLIRAEDQLSAARTKQTEAIGKARAAEADLEDAQQDAFAAAERVEDATIALAAAREQYGDGSKEAIAAEKDLARAQKESDKAALDLVKSQGSARKASADLANAQDDARSKAMLLEGVQRDLADAERLAAEEAGNAAESVANLGDEIETATEKSRGFGGRLLDGLKKVGTGALLGVGAQIGSTVTKGIGTAFESGFGRLQSIEQAQTMLGGLGHSAEGIATIMDNAMESVSGTAYGFGEAASMAATFAGAGIEQGEELTRILSLVGDSAAITGADFQEMGSIWTKMASSGRLSTDEMNQLMDRGLGLLPELQKHYNVTADEARKMVTDGKVNFQDFAEIMEGMVGGSAQAMGDTFGGSAANMRAALGRLGAKFLEPVFSNAPAIFQAVGGAVDTLGEKLGPLIEGWSERLQPVFEDFAERLGPALESAIEKTATVIGDLIDRGQGLIQWGQDNRTWIEPLAVSIGVLVAAYQALQFQQAVMAAGGFVKWLSQLNAVTKVTTALTRAQAGAQAALNLVMNANPIFLIVTAIAALAAGLVYFFTQTETGREMWSKFTTALVAGWDWLSGVLSSGWEWIKTTVFDAWNNAVDFLQASWNLATNALAFAWAWLKNELLTRWLELKKSVFDAWNATVTWVQENFDKVTDAISSSWSWLKDQLHAGYTWVKTNVFDAMTSALDTVKGWFDKTVDTIGTIWEKLRALTAKPVRFVVETVYGGLRNAWNKVAGLVGLGELPEVRLGELGNYARGGVLPGYTPGRDVHEFYSPTGGRIHLSGGEAIMRPEWVRAVGGPSAVDEMNRAAREGKTLAAGPHDHYALGGVWDLGAFATGGTLRKNPGVVLTTDIQRSMERAVAAAFPNQIITSATRYQEMGSGYDNHMAGRALDFAASHALADWIARTYPHSAELFWDPGPNLKNGRPTGAIGGHSDHVHWAMASMVDPYTGEVVSQDGPGGGFSLLDMAKRMWDKAIGAIGKFPGAETMGTIGKLPAAALSTLATGAWNFLRDKFAAVGSFFGGGGGGEQYRGQIEAAFRNQGEVPRTHLVDALVRQIDTESGGDPNTAQQIVDANGTGPSAGLGLYQFIPGTFAAYRDPSLPNDRTDPWAAHNAAVRYFRDRHNWNTGPGGVGRGHGWKSGGVLPLDLTTLFDTGGVWKHGTAGVNLSGADEYVFTNRAMRSFTEATESLRVVATELGVAFRGGDWGYMELARYIGDDLAKATIDVVAAVGRADRGFREWAAGDEERARMGTPEEWARHYGAQAGVAVADDVLGLFGLGGIVGGKFSDSFVNLVNAGADTVNGLHGTNFGHLQADALQARAIIDDEGRVIELDPTSPIVDEPAAVSVAGAPTSADASDSPVGAAPSGGSTTVIELDGGKVYGADDLEKLNGRVDGVEFRVKKLEEASVAAVGAAVGII